MITYDKEKKELTFKKYDCSDVDITLLQDLKDSYKRFVTETVKDDIKYLFERHFSNEKEKIDVEVHVDQQTVYGAWSYTRDALRFIPISFTMRRTNLITGQSYSDGNQDTGYGILEVPAMDTMGRIITRSGVKALVPALRPLESASWDAEKKTYNIACPNANISIFYTSSGKSQNIKMKLGGREVDFPTIIQGMLYSIGDKTNLRDICVSNVGRAICHLDGYTEVDTFLANQDVIASVKKFSPNNQLNGDMYNIGKTRESLNDLYDLRCAKGETLSRDVVAKDGTVIAPAGKVITDSDIRSFYRNCINVIYVTEENVSHEGLITAKPLTIYTLPEFTPNCAYLRFALPQYAEYNYIPEEVINEDGSPVIYIPEETKVTKDLLEFLHMLDKGPLTLLDERGDHKEVIISFERPIIGNYMVKLGYLVDAGKIPAGRSFDEWVYTYNNPTFEKTDEKVLSHMTVHDFEAILCDVCRIIQNGQSDNLLNRDTAFLKKLSLVHDQFSKYLRLTFDKKFRTSAQRNRYMASWKEGKNMARGITKAWVSAMIKDNVLAAYTVHNYMDEISMLTHANIKLKEAPDTMRHIAMPYFGRICGVETPAGKPLGLTNNRACLCRVDRDGNMLVPYYMITSKGGYPYIRRFDKSYHGINKDKIHWLSPKDELNNKIVSITDLEIDDNGYITNEYVLARVPNIDKSEPYLITTIKTKDLLNYESNMDKGDFTFEEWGSYCTVVPEQILSIAACTVPFIGADYATRVTYGLAQAKQAIYLKHTEEPVVKTSMYEKMLNLHYSKPICSPEDGVYNGFTQLYRGQCKVNDTLVDIAVPGSFEGRQGTFWTPHQYVYEGDKVSKGQPIVIDEEYPEPLNSYVRREAIVDHVWPENAEFIKRKTIQTELDHALPVGEDVKYSEWEIVHFQNSRIAADSIAFSNVWLWHDKKLKPGDIWKDTTMSRNGVYTPARMALLAYIPYGYNHEDGVVVTKSCTLKYTSMTVHHVKTNLPFDNYYTAQYNAPLFPRKPGEVLTEVFPSGKRYDQSAKVATIYADRAKHGITLESVVTRDNEFHKQHITTYMVSIDPLRTGDKMSGRHGNKGVVSLELPDSEAPQFMNGMIPDVILNPHGVPSRMNIGQILELHSSFCAVLTGIKINSDSFNGMTTAQVETFMHLVYDYSQWLKQCWVNSAADLVARIHSTPEFLEFGLPTEYIEQMWDNRKAVEEWIDCFNRDGTAQMYDPVTDTFFRTPIAFGYAYYYKLEQQVDLKLNERGGPLGEEYAFVTQQPTKTVNSSKGQKLGEMEWVALSAYGCSTLIEESMNEKSDNISLSYNKHIQKMGLNNLPQVDERYTQPASLESLINHMTALNVKVEAHESVIPSQDFSRHKETYNLKMAIRANESKEDSVEYNTGSGDYSELKNSL